MGIFDTHKKKEDEFITKLFEIAEALESDELDAALDIVFKKVSANGTIAFNLLSGIIQGVNRLTGSDYVPKNKAQLDIWLMDLRKLEIQNKRALFVQLGYSIQKLTSISINQFIVEVEIIASSAVLAASINKTTQEQGEK